MPDERDALDELHLTQHAVASRRQLLDLDVTHRQIDSRVRARKWQEFDGVVVMHNGELSVVQQQEVATRVGLRLVALAGRSAAGAEGLKGWSAATVEVLVPKGSTYPVLPFPVRIRESRRFVETDVIHRSPARVCLERAVVDAASWSASDKAACGILAASVQQRLTTADRLGAQLADAGQIQRRRLLRSAIDDIGGGAQAMSEIAFLRYCKRHGLPRPILQRVRLDAEGRRRYLDATFKKRSGDLLSVEIDGALHLVVVTYWNDMDRGNELVIADERQLRFPSWLIHADDPRPADQIRRALDLSVDQNVLSA